MTLAVAASIRSQFRLVVARVERFCFRASLVLAALSMPVALVASAMVPMRAAAPPTALDDLAHARALELERLVDGYAAQHGGPPDVSVGLSALIDAPLPGWPLDPWGRGYAYVVPAAHSPHGFDVVSAGADGLFASDDDVGNW